MADPAQPPVYTTASKWYYDFLHVPIALAVMLLHLLFFAGILGWNVVEVAWQGVVVAFAACFWREEAQEESREIIARGGLRAYLPNLWGLRVWEWSRHSLLETLYAMAAVIVLALLITLTH